MRLLPTLSVLIAVALCAPTSAADASSMTRVLATTTTAPPSASSASSASTDASGMSDEEAIATLRKYYGDDVDKLSDEQLQKLITKLRAQAQDDPSGLEALLEDSKDWFAKVGNSIKTIFTGKDDNNPENDGGVFSKIWTSLFGKESQGSANGTASATDSGSGSINSDVAGGSASMDTSIDEATTASSASADDTSIDAVAPTPAPTPLKTTPTSSSRAKLWTSLPVAGTLAAVFVINFVQ